MGRIIHTVDDLPEQILFDLASPGNVGGLGAVIVSACLAGWSQAVLAEAAGISRQAVHQRFRSARVPIADLKQYDAPPFPAYLRRKEWPIDTVPDETLAELARLRELTSKVRGTTPMDSPSRLAIPEFATLLLETIETYGVTTYSLSKRLGLSAATLDFWLKRHGHRKNPPSQKTYTATYRDPHLLLSGRPKYEVGGVCGKGHELTEDTLIVKPHKQLCRVCRNERVRRRYYEKKAQVS